MPITFKFRKEKSSLLGIIYRPIATVFFQNIKTKSFKPVKMIVDTGADYTLLPRFLSSGLGINLVKDCRKLSTAGVGGEEIVFFCKRKLKVKLGNWKKRISLGFLNNDFIPPLLGRYEFFNTFKVIFDKRKLTFIKSYKK